MRPYLAVLAALFIAGFSCSVPWTLADLAPQPTLTPQPIAITPTATPAQTTEVASVVMAAHEGPLTYGRSFEGRPLLAYRFGSGPTRATSS